MKWQRIALVFTILSLLTVPLAWSQGGNAEQQIRNLTDELRVAQLKADTNTVEKLYADDYAAIRGDGVVQTKTQEIESLKSGTLTYEKIDVQDLKIRVYGKTAVGTNLIFSKGITNGKPRNTNIRTTRIWVKRNGDWRCVAYQSTRVLTPAPTAAQLKEQLVGTWRLVSFKRETLASGEITDIFGKAPKGYITYGQDGRMMVLFVKDERPKPDDLAKLTDQQRADLFKTMYAYSGTYDFDGKTVTHHIDVSWNENWTNTDQRRAVTFDGRRVILTTLPAPAGVDGTMAVHTLTWEKVE